MGLTCLFYRFLYLIFALDILYCDINSRVLSSIHAQKDLYQHKKRCILQIKNKCEISLSGLTLVFTLTSQTDSYIVIGQFLLSAFLSMSFMYFGSLTTPFAELLQPFFSPTHHRIHLLIDSIISVEITVSDEIWKLHHTCRCERGGKKGRKGERRKKKNECHNS